MVNHVALMIIHFEPQLNVFLWEDKRYRKCTTLHLQKPHRINTYVHSPQSKNKSVFLSFLIGQQ